MTYGLFDTGLVVPTIDELTEDISASYLANIDPALDLSADQPMGQAVAISADREMQRWAVIQTLYQALDPDAAEGILLDNVNGFIGLRRRSATYSYLYGVQLTLASSTTITAGATISVNGNPQSVWVLQNTVVSTSAGVYTATFQSQVPGPQVANATTATVIGTPTVGWTAVSNPSDAAQGIPQDTDAVYRSRRVAELSAASVGPIDGQRAALLSVPNITAAFVIENTGNTTLGDGTPPHNTHAILYSTNVSAPTSGSPLANLIAAAIWSKKDGGNGAYGSLWGTTIDSADNVQTLHFDWAASLPVYATCVVTPAPGVTIGSDQATAIKAALAAYALAAWELGEDVYYTPFRNAAVLSGVSVDVSSFAIGFAPSPVGTSTLVLTQLQIATLSTANITVNGI